MRKALTAHNTATYKGLRIYPTRPAVKRMRLVKVGEYKETTKKGHKRTIIRCTYVNTGKDYRKGAE